MAKLERGNVDPLDDELQSDDLAPEQRQGLEAVVKRLKEVFRLCPDGDVTIEADEFIQHNVLGGCIETPKRKISEAEEKRFRQGLAENGTLFAVSRLFRNLAPDTASGYGDEIQIPGSQVWACYNYVKELIQPWDKWRTAKSQSEHGRAPTSIAAFLTPEEEQRRATAFQKIRKKVNFFERVLNVATDTDDSHKDARAGSSNSGTEPANTFGECFAHFRSWDAFKARSRKFFDKVDGPLNKGTAAVFYHIEGCRWDQEAAKQHAMGMALDGYGRLQAICEAELGSVTTDRLTMLRGRLAMKLGCGSDDVNKMTLLEFADRWNSPDNFTVKPTGSDGPQLTDAEVEPKVADDRQEFEYDGFLLTPKRCVASFHQDGKKMFSTTNLHRWETAVAKKFCSVCKALDWKYFDRQKAYRKCHIVALADAITKEGLSDNPWEFDSEAEL